MFAYDPGDDAGAALLPVAPAPPVLSPPGAAAPQELASSSPPRNSNGETLAEAEAAVLAEVRAGALGADALARHPLPAGTSTAEALRFLASLPQTVYQSGQPGGTVIGPPIDTLPPPSGPPAPPEPRNANGETLAQAEAAVLELVAGGMDASDAFALHQLPPGTPEPEVIRFLNSLPPSGARTQPPGAGGVAPNPPGTSVDVSGDDDERELESARKPAGVARQWRGFVDVFKVGVPAQHRAVNSFFDTPKEFFR